MYKRPHILAMVSPWFSLGILPSLGYVLDSVWSVDEYTITPSPGATKVVMIEMGDDRIKVLHDEVGVSGPVTRYGLFYLGDTKISLSNIIGGGHVVGAGSIGEDGIVIMTSPSGQISGKTIANINPDKGFRR